MANSSWEIRNPLTGSDTMCHHSTGLRAIQPVLHHLDPAVKVQSQSPVRLTLPTCSWLHFG
jgi:hypothetical protein